MKKTTFCSPLDLLAVFLGVNKFFKRNDWRFCCHEWVKKFLEFLDGNKSKFIDEILAMVLSDFCGFYNDLLWRSYNFAQQLQNTLNSFNQMSPVTNYKSPQNLIPCYSSSDLKNTQKNNSNLSFRNAHVMFIFQANRNLDGKILILHFMYTFSSLCIWTFLHVHRIYCSLNMDNLFTEKIEHWMLWYNPYFFTSIVTVRKQFCA